MPVLLGLSLFAVLLDVVLGCAAGVDARGGAVCGRRIWGCGWGVVGIVVMAAGAVGWREWGRRDCDDGA